MTIALVLFVAAVCAVFTVAALLGSSRARRRADDDARQLADLKAQLPALNRSVRHQGRRFVIVEDASPPHLLVVSATPEDPPA